MFPPESREEQRRFQASSKLRVVQGLMEDSQGFYDVVSQPESLSTSPGDDQSGALRDSG